MVKLDLSKVKFSRADIKRKIKIPKHLNPSLSELIGIHIGDGSIYLFADKKRSQISYTGSVTEDYEYYLSCVAPLLEQTFGIGTRIEQFNTWVFIRIHSLALYTFFHYVIRLPVGKKATKAWIPRSIFQSSEEIMFSFLRGLADTDFSLTFQKKHKEIHYYPILKISVASKQLIRDLEDMLTSLGFKVHTEFDRGQYDKRTNKIYIKNYLFLNGNKNLEKWMKLIGFHNPKHLTKYLIWKRYGFCPPRTTLKERCLILNGKLNIHNLKPP